VQSFNEQLEKLAEMALVLLVGAMLAYAKPLPAAWWFVPLMIVVLRPLSVVASTVGEGLTTPQHAMIGWFGIRGIGSLYYLMYATNHGLEHTLAANLGALVFSVVVASIVVHGVSVTPLMSLYERRKRRRARA
jgi:NhaP-type Na+/H+ or K+/H+ antiporter